MSHSNCSDNCGVCRAWALELADLDVARCVREDLVSQSSQPAPRPNHNPAIPSLVIEDVLGRANFGYKKYGTYLQGGNGRDSLRDAYEEALDLCQYLRQALWERDGK